MTKNALEFLIVSKSLQEVNGICKKKQTSIQNGNQKTSMKS